MTTQQHEFGLSIILVSLATRTHDPFTPQTVNALESLYESVMLLEQNENTAEDRVMLYAMTRFWVAVRLWDDACYCEDQLAPDAPQGERLAIQERKDTCSRIQCIEREIISACAPTSLAAAAVMAAHVCADRAIFPDDTADDALNGLAWALVRGAAAGAAATA
jgi:hypothetical protein